MNTKYHDDLEQQKAKAFKNAHVKAAYGSMEDEFRLIEILIAARHEKQLTQAQLARKLGMQQEAIARLESGTANPTYKTLARVAKALDKRIAFI